MSDIIHTLPESVANQIAAGEVIQRPASVVKELVENAADAGATEIQVVIKDAGRTLIQVIDNGRGMSPTDARMAFERHATSKITQAADLFTLHTMGFRGEALPSICAIAQVELRTMQPGDSIGTRLLISGSRVEAQEPCVCTQGANFMVKNLFFNVPARRKFLHSDSSEIKAITAEFERLALVNNNLRLTLNTGTRIIDLRPGSFKQRIADLWKNGLDKHLIPIEVDMPDARISGFITQPTSARRRGALQYLIANGRNMTHHPFRKAILRCYEGIIAHDTQPSFFLKFEVDPATIDVNIHPTKSEIKFEREGVIRLLLEKAVKGALGRYGSGPAIDFTQDIMPLDPARDGDFVPAPEQGIDPAYNPFAATASTPPFSTPASARSRRAEVRGWESLLTGFMNDAAESAVAQESATLESTPDESTLEIPGLVDTPRELEALCLQVADKYILTPMREGLCVIDQHRAHVRVLYDRYMKRLTLGSDAMAMQKSVFPEKLTLTETQSSMLEEITPDIERLGFLLSRGDSPHEWLIEGSPASLHGHGASQVIFNILDSAADDVDTSRSATEAGSEELLGRAALVMARAAAFQRGRRLTRPEMEQLLSDLFSLPDHSFTPSGNPIMRVISIARLDSLFS